MSQQRTEEFKRAAVEKFQSRGSRSVEEVARVLGVSSWSLYQWSKRYGKAEGMNFNARSKPARTSFGSSIGPWPLDACGTPSLTVSSAFAVLMRHTRKKVDSGRALVRFSLTMTDEGGTKARSPSEWLGEFHFQSGSITSSRTWLYEGISA
jgi:transposase-like protein